MVHGTDFKCILTSSLIVALLQAVSPFHEHDGSSLLCSSECVMKEQQQQRRKWSQRLKKTVLNVLKIKCSCEFAANHYLSTNSDSA